MAPNSKKQRVAKQQLAAAQGKSAAEVRRAGGRYEHVTPGWQAPGAHGASDQDEARSVVATLNQWQQDQSWSWRSEAINRLANYMRDNPEPGQTVKR